MHYPHDHLNRTFDRLPATLVELHWVRERRFWLVIWIAVVLTFFIVTLPCYWLLFQGQPQFMAQLLMQLGILSLLLCLRGWQLGYGLFTPRGEIRLDEQGVSVRWLVGVRWAAWTARWCDFKSVELWRWQCQNRTEWRVELIHAQSDRSIVLFAGREAACRAAWKHYAYLLKLPATQEADDGRATEESLFPPFQVRLGIRPSSSEQQPQALPGQTSVLEPQPGVAGALPYVPPSLTVRRTADELAVRLPAERAPAWYIVFPLAWGTATLYVATTVPGAQAMTVVGGLLLGCAFLAAWLHSRCQREIRFGRRHVEFVLITPWRDYYCHAIPYDELTAIVLVYERGRYGVRYVYGLRSYPVFDRLHQDAAAWLRDFSLFTIRRLQAADTSVPQRPFRCDWMRQSA